MPREIKAGETTATRRTVHFQLVTTDGITPAIFEAAGQPQISTNNGSWTNTGIGTLSHVGNGRYSATLTVAAVATAGDWIETRYKSANTAECPGDSVEVVDFDPTSEQGSWENVVIETGINARQALSLVTAACAGVLTGGGSTQILVFAAGDPNTQRINMAVTLSGSRTSVGVNPPA